MVFNRVIFRYLVCLSVVWLLTLWIKLTFADFVSNGPLQLFTSGYGGRQRYL